MGANTVTWDTPDVLQSETLNTKPSAVYIIDPTTNKVSAGAGGGAATIADGANVTQGTTTDANTVDTVMGRLTKIRDNLNTLVTDNADLLADGDHLATIDSGIASLVTATADLLADGDHLATIDTSTAAMVPGVQAWIAATGTGVAAQDDSLTFANQVRKVVLYNAATVPVPFEFDATSAATSIPIQPGQYMIFDDVLCTIVHVFPSATLPINTTAGLYVKGWK